MRRLVVLLCGYTAVALGQVEIPSFQSLKRFDWRANNNGYRPGFLKKLTIESFGMGRSALGPGFDFPMRLTDGPITSHGLECPRCIVRPTMDRAKYTLPEFGARATLPLWRGRAQLFSGFGGVNAWKPDNTGIELGQRGRALSLNDAWLLQGEFGGRIAVDPGQHFWLGGVGRYLQNFGVGKKHWNSVSGSATFTFGR